MMKPTIHRNGTSREELLEQVCEVGRAIRVAMKVLGDAAPNGRDYYPQGATVIETALDEHAERIAKLGSILSDMQELAEHIADAK